jgi:hypothetical protein
MKYITFSEPPVGWAERSEAQQKPLTKANREGFGGTVLGFTLFTPTYKGEISR